MADDKFVLIVENSVNGLRPINESTQIVNVQKEYILSGVFTEFNVLNRNERIYTADKFLPHLQELNERKNTLGAVYGEFDHPDVFDTSLSRISHTIEKVFYNQEKNRVDGEIRLLNTHWGKEAKALVDDNCPLFVSSRAAGITESNGTVTVKKLFTYDAVADPGFSSAKMEMKSINESFGFTNENTNFRIYDISDESKINELFEMNNNDFITKSQMVDYSNYLTEEIQKVKLFLENNAKGGNINPAEITKMADLYENMRSTQEKLEGYLDYLADTVQHVVNENKELKTTTEKLAEHNDYLAENLEKSINYSEYLAEQLDKTIDYSEYIAETLDKNIDFSEYIAEHVNKNIEFSDYLAENLEKSIDYSEYLAENLDKNIAYSEYIAENVDNNIAYSEYIAENLDKNIAYSEYIAENLDNNIAYAEYIAEHVDNNIAYSEYIAENVSDTQAYMNYIAEGLDNTIEGLKNGKLNEEFGQAQIPNLRDIDNVSKYYDEDDEIQVQPGAQTDIDVQAGANVDIDVQAGAQVDVQPEAGAQVQVQPEAGAQVQIQPEAGAQIEMPGLDDELGAQPITGADVQPSVEGEALAQTEIVPGAVVAIGDKTGEVLASNPTNGIVTVKIEETGEAVEIHESKVNVLKEAVLESDSLVKHIGDLITETKKRKASEENEPHFLQFLTEKNKKSWYNLSTEDKEKVTFAINESEQVYSETQLLHVIQKTLSVEKSFDQVLLESMPASLKPVWESIGEEYKTSVLSQAKLYPNLNNDAKIEAFWESRNLEKYVSINETKTMLNENKNFDNDNLSDDYIDSFISKIKNLDR